MVHPSGACHSRAGPTTSAVLTTIGRSALVADDAGIWGCILRTTRITAEGSADIAMSRSFFWPPSAKPAPSRSVEADDIRRHVG